ncbi:MAG: MCE family protein [Candidatus Cloacimonetes bacterium]|nr:MCE family protein [Candidatus Cloacimonadota bacterium]
MSKFYHKIHRTQTIVGIFTLVILIALIVSYAWLRNRFNLKTQRELKVHFEDINGLEIGDKVVFRGMEVGRIKQVQAVEDGVIISSRIDAHLLVPDDSRFSIRESSLMGGKHFAIEAGRSGKPMDFNRIHPGDVSPGIMTLLAKAAVSIDEMYTILVQLRQPGGLIDGSETLVASADGLISNFDQSRRSLEREITSMVRQIDHLSKAMNTLVTSNQQDIGRITATAPAMMGNINATLDSLQNLAGRLNNAALKLQDDRNTAGKLLTDDKLYNDLSTALDNLNALIEDVKTNPKKYVRFSLF